jgi:outer membrane biosynthesis protein TonB
VRQEKQVTAELVKASRIEVLKSTTRAEAVDTATEISAPAEFSSEEKELYLSYYDSIRRSIQTTAERYYRNSYISQGDIRLRFTVASDGTLNNVYILEGGTTAGPLLRRLALQSVKGANPFPAFPEQLDKKELCFNLLISFKSRRY